MPCALCCSMESRRVRRILDKWPFTKEIANARPFFSSRLRVSTSLSYSFIESRFTAHCYTPHKTTLRCVFRESAHPRAYRILWHTGSSDTSNISWVQYTFGGKKRKLEWTREFSYERVTISEKRVYSLWIRNNDHVQHQLCRILYRECLSNIIAC